MVKIKREVKKNLPQLIEWAWDNGVRNVTFRGLDKKGYVVSISINDKGEFTSDWRISKNDLFTVEVEEEITEDTVFHTLVKVIEDGTVYTCTDATINREKNSAVVEIHAILNGVLKLIWTHDKGLVE